MRGRAMRVVRVASEGGVLSAVVAKALTLDRRVRPIDPGDRGRSAALA